MKTRTIFKSLLVITLQLFGLAAVLAQSAIEPLTTPDNQGGETFGHIKQLKAGLLDVGYVEAGPANGQAVLLIHGWPYDIYSYKEVSEILGAKRFRVLILYLKGFGSTTFLSEEIPRNGQQSAFAVDLISFMDALEIKTPLSAASTGAQELPILWLYCGRIG